MTKPLGRDLFGAASLLLGIACLALRDQLASSWQWPGDGAFLIVTSLALIAGGAAIPFRKTETLGAAVLGSVYAVFALTFVPAIVAQPGAYYTWGNMCYPLASVAGALVVYCLAKRVPRGQVICKAAVVVFGICTASYAAEQLEFLGRTAGLVPKWMPPGGMFWAIATTVAFGLAAIALVSGYKALLAARLTGLMLALFGIAVWIPILIADPKTHSNWSEGIETFVIAGAAWIVADFLDRATQADVASSEAQIRALIEDWARAVRTEDLEGAVRSHADDVLLFDVPLPVQLRGLGNYRDSWKQFFGNAPKPIVFTLRELEIDAGTDVAFAHALISCQDNDGGRSEDLAIRLTVGLRKIDGAWTVMHEHHSEATA